ncbi:MAG: VWA domain-containing protein [Acidobacteria bacterium]|nr:VWA domain-containing protein [Acidobacteriota bacterium]
MAFRPLQTDSDFLRRNVCVLSVALLLSCFAWSCRKQPPQPALLKTPSPQRAILPVDFAICIDNSRSITEPEQKLVRETVMLLADLADPGDRLSLITFGEGARLVKSILLGSDRDKIGFRETVRENVKFDEKKSDIRAGIRVVAENVRGLFRPQDKAVRVAVLFSDGRMEPADGDTQQALEEMQKYISSSIVNIDIYAVVLGDTYSRIPINGLREQPINGQLLMQRYLARSANRYYHAKSLDQILEAAVHILSKSKGITSLGETGEPSFKIDETVESMSFIVRKRSTGRGELYASTDIQLKWPGMKSEESIGSGTTSLNNTPTSVYWNDQYEFFDVITVRKPIAGLWEIGLKTNRPIEFLSRIITPIELRIAAKEHYFLNESSTLSAYLFDRNSKSIPKEECKIQAKIAADAASLNKSNTYVELQKAADSSEFHLEMPSSVAGAAGRKNLPGTLALQLIAERPNDEWFIRRSTPFIVELREPFVEWRRQAATSIKIPLYGNWPAIQPFAGAINREHPNYPQFEAPPQTILLLERYDDDSRAFQPCSQTILTSASGERAVLSDQLSKTGIYRYSYMLEGNDRRTGPYTLRSPWYSMDIRWGWEYAVGEIVLLWLIAWLFLNLLAKTAGTVTVFPAEGNRIDTTLSRKRAVIYAESQTAFMELKGGYSLLFRKFIKMRVLYGTVTVNGIRLSKGKTSSSRPRKLNRFTYQLPPPSGTAGRGVIQANVRIGF